jgi:hypothetical protein
MTLQLPPGVSLGSIPAGGIIADSDWTVGDDDDAELDEEQSDSGLC